MARSKFKTESDGRTVEKESFLSVLEAPREKPLRILGIAGGEGVKRRLLAIGFHRGDIIEVDSSAIISGPLLVRNTATNTRVALGRGVAKKILVEIADGTP